MKPSSPLSETTINTGNYFQFEYDKDYQRLQIQFLDYVDQHNLQGIMVCLEKKPRGKVLIESISQLRLALVIQNLHFSS